MIEVLKVQCAPVCYHGWYHWVVILPTDLIDTVNITVGDTVLADGHAGTVRFVGTTEFASGEWVGVVFDQPGLRIN